MRDFFDRTKLYWTTEIVRRREASEGPVTPMSEKVTRKKLSRGTCLGCFLAFLCSYRLFFQCVHYVGRSLRKGIHSFSLCMPIFHVRRRRECYVWEVQSSRFRIMKFFSLKLYTLLKRAPCRPTLWLQEGCIELDRIASCTYHLSVDVNGFIRVTRAVCFLGCQSIVGVPRVNP